MFTTSLVALPVAVLAFISFPDPVVASGWGVAFVTFIMAAFERYKNHKAQAKRETKAAGEAELLSDAKMHAERADILRKLADDNLVLYKQEHEEHKRTRDFWHEKSGEFQATLTTCQEKLADFQARPDLTKVMQSIEANSETSVQILKGIREIIDFIRQKDSSLQKV